MKAIYKDNVIAEGAEMVKLEGNNYFPAVSVRAKYLRSNGRTYDCPWKGRALYYDIVIGDEILTDGAWMYPEPSSAAKEIKGLFAFSKEVDVID